VTDGPGNKQEKFKKTRIYKIDLTCCFTLEDLEPYLARNMFSNLPCPDDCCPRNKEKEKTYKKGNMENHLRWHISEARKASLVSKAQPALRNNASPLSGFSDYFEQPGVTTEVTHLSALVEDDQDQDQDQDQEQEQEQEQEQKLWLEQEEDQEQDQDQEQVQEQERSLEQVLALIDSWSGDRPQTSLEDITPRTPGTENDCATGRGLGVDRRRLLRH